MVLVFGELRKLNEVQSNYLLSERRLSRLWLWWQSTAPLQRSLAIIEPNIVKKIGHFMPNETQYTSNIPGTAFESKYLWMHHFRTCSIQSDVWTWSVILKCRTVAVTNACQSKKHFVSFIGSYYGCMWLTDGIYSSVV